jgi:hypothetical protein
MPLRSAPRVLVSGACVIIASLFSTGCQVVPVREPMAIVDLERFTVDCRIKEQQIQMLQSMRTSADDRLWNHMRNVVAPWQHYTQPGAWRQRQQLSQGRSDWLINQNLLILGNNCP